MSRTSRTKIFAFSFFSSTSSSSPFSSVLGLAYALLKPVLGLRYDVGRFSWIMCECVESEGASLELPYEWILEPCSGTDVVRLNNVANILRHRVTAHPSLPSSAVTTGLSVRAGSSPTITADPSLRTDMESEPIFSDSEARGSGMYNNLCLAFGAVPPALRPRHLSWGR